MRGEVRLLIAFALLSLAPCEASAGWTGAPLAQLPLHRRRVRAHGQPDLIEEPRRFVRELLRLLLQPLLFRLPAAEHVLVWRSPQWHLIGCSRALRRPRAAEDRAAHS
jgi:hypothetical protein